MAESGQGWTADAGGCAGKGAAELGQAVAFSSKVHAVGVGQLHPGTQGCLGVVEFFGHRAVVLEPLVPRLAASAVSCGVNVRRLRLAIGHSPAAHDASRNVHETGSWSRSVRTDNANAPCRILTC